MVDLMYKKIEVWKRVSENEMVLFICFETIPSGKFVVQSADFYRVGSEVEQYLSMKKQQIELFVEETPDSRSDTFHSLEEAIQAHLDEFS